MKTRVLGCLFVLQLSWLGLSCAKLQGPGEKSNPEAWMIESGAGKPDDATDAEITAPRPGQALLSFTFDDGYASTLQLAAPVLAEFGMPGVAYVPTGLVGRERTMTWEQVAALESEFDWEIGSHTVTHPDLASYAQQRVSWELTQSKMDLLARGISVGGFAAPYGAYDAKVLAAAAQHYPYLRPFEDSEAVNLWPYNRYVMRIRSVQVGVKVEEVFALIDQAVAAGGWLVLVFHDIVDPAQATPQGWAYSSRDLADIAAYASKQPMEVRTVAQALAQPSQNLVSNGSFDGQMLGWQTDRPQRVGVDENGHGAYPSPVTSVHFEEGAGAAHLFGEKIIVTPGRIYGIEAFVNAVELGAGTIGFYVDEFDGSGAWCSGQYKTEVQAGMVTSAAFRYEPTSSTVEAASLQVFVTKDAKGTAYVDEVRIFGEED